MIAFALGYAALLALSIVNDRVATHSVQLVTASYDRELAVYAGSRNVVRLVIDMERADRGLSVVGDHELGESYEAARQKLPVEEAALRALVAEDPEAAAVADQMIGLADRWVREVGDPAMAALSAQKNAPLPIVRPGGDDLVGRIRELSQQLRAQAHQRAEASAERGKAERARVRMFAFAIALLLSLPIFLYALRRARRLDRDVTRLAKDADQLAAGQFTRQPDGVVESPALVRIERALDRAVGALAWRDAEARALLAVSREISAASSISALVARVQAAVVSMVPGSLLAIVRLSTNDQRLLATTPGLDLPVGTITLAPNSVYHRVLTERSLHAVDDLRSNEFAEDSFFAEAGFSSYAVISVFVGSEAFAAVVVALRTGRFAPAQLSFIDTLVQQIAHQIEAAELRDSLSQSNEELQRATNAKSDFLAMMSHELRTPLNSVVGFSEVLADQKFGELNEKQERFIKNVLDSGRHLLRLINDLLDLSKIEAGKLEVNRQRCGIRTLAVEVVTAVQMVAAARRIEVVVEDAVPPAMLADPVRVKQILYNFLSNALKFSPEGGRVEIGFSSGTDSVRVTVRDNGPGISLAEQERLFKPFSQLDRSQPQVATIGGSSLGGTGLGLALARQLSVLMQGRVGVQSEPEAGSLFWLELPRDNVSKPLPSVPAQKILAAAPMALVVDDDPAARELVELALQQAGYRTAAAATGEEALSAARRLRPDVITLDVFLPGIDGWDVLRVLGTDSATRGIPVVMLTISPDRQKAFTLGAVEHLTKPFDQAALARAIPRAPEGAAPAMVRVLLIAQDPSEELKNELVTRGFEVTTSGEDGALSALHDTLRVDLVLLDAVHADGKALEIVKSLRADPRTRELPVVLMAQNVADADRQQVGRLVQAVLDRSQVAPGELAREVGGVVMDLARAARS